MTNHDEQLKAVGASEADFSDTFQPGFVRLSVACKALTGHTNATIAILREQEESLEKHYKAFFLKAFNIAAYIWIGSVIAAVAITYWAMK